MRLVSPPLAFLLFALALAPACADDTPIPQCVDGKCDDPGTVARALLDCWLEESESDDDFFRLDKLHCSYQPDLAALDMHTVTVEVTTADGQRGSARFTRDNAGTEVFVAGVHSDGFPLEMNVQTILDFTDRNDEVIGIDRLRQTTQAISLQGLADATIDTPLQVSLPFDVIDLDFLNRHVGEARIEFGHDIVIGETSIAIDKTHQIIDFGRRSQVAVPVTRDAPSIGATITLHENVGQGEEIARYETAFAGSGVYEISLDSTRQVGEEEFVEPEGHPMALCRLMTNRIPPADAVHAFHCFGNPAPGVEETRHLRITPAAAAGETAVPIDVDFLASGEVSVALEAHQLPALVEIHSVLSDGTSGLRRLASRTHVARQEVSLTEDFFNAFLPFKLWTVQLEASEDLVFARIEPSERFLELGYQWSEQFALHVLDDETLSAQPTSPASLVIAVPADVDFILGRLEAIDQQGGVTRLDVEFSQGLWRASKDGLTAVD